MTNDNPNRQEAKIETLFARLVDLIDVDKLDPKERLAAGVALELGEIFLKQQAEIAHSLKMIRINGLRIAK